MTFDFGADIDRPRSSAQPPTSCAWAERDLAASEMFGDEQESVKSSA